MIIRNYKLFVESVKHKMDIPEDIRKIHALFKNADKDLFLVGGCVRDFIQGKTPHDYDLVTNSLPEESKKILKGWNVSDEQGKNFGVLRIYTEDEPSGYELATYRRDISKGRDTKGDDQKVEIGNVSLKEDLQRRDFTQNALVYNIDNDEIIDLVGGVDDIKNKIIRAVGDPSKRFEEDRLRILRCIRFSARTSSKVDKETSDAIKRDNRLRGIGPKDDVSQERILEEWNKMRNHAINDIDMMQDYINMLFEYDMIPEMWTGLNFNDKMKVEFMDNAILFYDLFLPNTITSLCHSHHISGLKKLKFPIDLIQQIEFLRNIDWRWADMNSLYNLAKMKMRYKIEDQLIIKLAKHIKYIPDRWINAFLDYCNDGFVIDGNDLMAKGFKGKAIELEKERLEIKRFKNEYYI